MSIRLFSPSSSWGLMIGSKRSEHKKKQWSGCSSSVCEWRSCKKDSWDFSDGISFFFLLLPGATGAALGRCFDDGKITLHILLRAYFQPIYLMLRHIAIFGEEWNFSNEEIDGVETKRAGHYNLDNWNVHILPNRWNSSAREKRNQIFWFSILREINWKRATLRDFSVENLTTTNRH